jgi:hypothetical protein
MLVYALGYKLAMAFRYCNAFTGVASIADESQTHAKILKTQTYLMVIMFTLYLLLQYSPKS